MTAMINQEALAKAMEAQAEAYRGYNAQRVGLSDKSWRECHGDATPSDLALSAAITAYIEALPHVDRAGVLEEAAKVAER